MAEVRLIGHTHKVIISCPLCRIDVVTDIYVTWQGEGHFVSVVDALLEFEEEHFCEPAQNAI